MAAASGDFELTMDELRAITRYVTESAQSVLPTFEAAHLGDARPRTAIQAARTFADGAARTKLQRDTALDAHRAAKEAATEEARLAARCAGDAAASAYLHPLAKATQVGHILRAAASAARIAELQTGGDPATGSRAVEEARQRATPTVIDVLRRYPSAPDGKGRVAQLMVALDTSLRTVRPQAW